MVPLTFETSNILEYLQFKCKVWHPKDKFKIRKKNLDLQNEVIQTMSLALLQPFRGSVSRRRASCLIADKRRILKLTFETCSAVIVALRFHFRHRSLHSVLWRNCMLSFFSHFFFLFQPRALFCTVHFLSGASRDVCDVAFRCLTHFAAAKMSDDSFLRKKKTKKITHLCLSSDPLSLSAMLHPIHPSNNVNQALYCQFLLVFFLFYYFFFFTKCTSVEKNGLDELLSPYSHISW